MQQRGHSTFELINSYGYVLLHPMLVSATVMAKCVPENVEVVCPHELPVPENVEVVCPHELPVNWN